MIPMGPDNHLLDVLASLNEIGATINRIGPRDHLSVEARLALIVESAIKVIPDSSAVIYTYDEGRRAFDPASRVSAGELAPPVPGDEPRPDGMGMRAIGQRRRVISYEEQQLPIHPIKVDAGAKTVACFPLVVAGQTLGALYVYLREDRRYSQLELLMLENFVNQAAMAIYHTRQLSAVQRDLGRKEDELNRLRRAGLLISSRLRLEETLEAILQMALEVTGARYGIFRLMDKKGQNLITSAIAGDAFVQPYVDAISVEANSVMSWVARHRQPVRISDLRLEPWSQVYVPLDVDLEMRSELAVPLIGAGGRLEGVLNLESPMVGAFSQEDSHLLQSLATQAVVAIQEARLLDALLEVAQLLLIKPTQEVLCRLVELACDLLNAAASVVWILDRDQLRLVEASREHPREVSLPLHNSLAGQAILLRGPVTCEDVRSDPLFYRPDLAREYGWTGAMIAPLVVGDQQDPVGAFSVYGSGTGPGRFVESDWDKKVLTCLAHYAALAVQNSTRLDALRAAQEQSAIAETFAAVGDIAANLLHNLNNKVGTIPVRIQGIQDKCRPVLQADPYLAANLAEIECSASEAMEAVRENLSHLHPIHIVPVDVVRCVDEAVRSTHLPPGIKIRSIDLERLPVVMAGERSLVLVFTNLLENSSDAMRGRGTVTFHGSIQEDWVEISVSDTGPGIPPELQDRIFERNFTGRAAPSSTKLGFGLWWVKTVMTRLGGSVAVESDGLNGTTFHLKLPGVQGIEAGP